MDMGAGDVAFMGRYDSLICPFGKSATNLN